MTDSRNPAPRERERAARMAHLFTELGRPPDRIVDGCDDSVYLYFFWGDGTHSHIEFEADEEDAPDGHLTCACICQEQPRVVAFDCDDPVASLAIARRIARLEVL